MKHLLLSLIILTCLASCKKGYEELNTTPVEVTPPPTTPPAPEQPKTFIGPDQLTYDIDSISTILSEIKIEVIKYTNLIGTLTAPASYKLPIVGLVKDKDSLKLEWAFSKSVNFSKLYKRYWSSDYGKWVSRNEIDINLSSVGTDLAINAFLTFSKSGKQVNRTTKLFTPTTNITADIYGVDFSMSWQQVKERELERTKKYTNSGNGMWYSNSPENGYSGNGPYAGGQSYFEFKDDKLIRVSEVGDFYDNDLKAFIAKVKGLGMPNDPIIIYDYKIGGYVLTNPQSWSKNGIKMTFHQRPLSGGKLYALSFEKP